MAIDRTEISKIETFKQIALLKHSAFEGIAHLLQGPTEFREPLQMGPRMVFDLIVSF